VTSPGGGRIDGRGVVRGPARPEVTESAKACEELLPSGSPFRLCLRQARQYRQRAI
jgi:hypothetical protein